MSIYRETPRNGESRVKGPTDVDLLEETIPELLARAVSRHGQREALVFPEHEVRLTYAEFAAAVDRLATGLLDLGIARGDRVGIWAPNRPEWVLTQFATARIGAILVNVNPAYRAGELEYALRRVGIRCLILADRFKSSNYVNMIQHVAPELMFCAPGALMTPNLPDLRIVVRMGDSRSTAGMLNFAALAATPADPDRLDAVTRTLRADDPINIQYTSGTTGFPKGATLSHRNILNNGYLVGEACRYTEEDRVCIPVPFYHCFGMVMGNLAATSHGACMVIPAPSFEPAATLRAVVEERCTSLYGVPTMFIAELGLEGKMIIGYAGSLVDYEGLDLLLLAAAELKKTRDDFAVIIVGDGHFEGQLHRMARELDVLDGLPGPSFTGRATD